MELNEAKEVLEENGYLLEDDEVPTNKVYIVVMDGGENDEDYAVFTSMLEAHKWGDSWSCMWILWDFPDDEQGCQCPLV